MAKVGSSAKFGVAVFKASMPDSPGGGSISQSRFICQVWCSGIQGIYDRLFRGGSSSAKVCSSAKFCVLVFKANITCQTSNLLLSFGGCFRHVLGVFQGVSGGVKSDMTVPC